MKTSSTSLGVISGLIVLAAADALPPEDVPIPCATICGPIVELSSKCVPAKGNRKRDIIIEGLRTDDEADASQNEDGVDGEMDKRFFTVVPAPTSFPAQLSSVLLNPYGGSGGDDEESSSFRLNGSPARITPVIVQTPRNTTLILPSARPPPSLASPSLRPPPPAQVPAVMSSATLVLPPSRPFGAAPTLNPSRSPPSDPAKGPMSMSMVAEPNMSDGADAGQALDTEARCVCLNRSFDVALVAALCTSCITKNGDSQTGMRNVMSVCDFAPRNYSPSDDAVVNNIRVSANRPPAVWGQNTGVANLAADTRRRLGGASVAAGVLAAWAIWRALY
ncbi:hypothetical protein AAL_00941 [Moelleriella libera RCEF 2490]|uniref:Uncharacterized protein n=1 Tax=Moelleriella libera RCEF 2490 TaxID=1081109 RepID=A0A166VBD4_9HYPO|nr:hypothetical protein AAL_00941 [Moelleriella libera RCEF 2490]